MLSGAARLEVGTLGGLGLLDEEEGRANGTGLSENGAREGTCGNGHRSCTRGMVPTNQLSDI